MMAMVDEKEIKKEIRKINSRIKMLSIANQDIPKELYERLRKLEEVMEKWKKTN